MTSDTKLAKRQSLTQLYYLSELIRAKVVVRGKAVGSFSDVAIRDGDVAAEVTHIYVARPFGYPALLIPWERVRSISTREIVIDVKNLSKYEAEPAKDMILLKDHLLDKKVLDLEGREVEVVYDVRMVMASNKLYVSDVDISRYGLLRRIGLSWLADFFYNMLSKIKGQTISWKYIQPLPTEIGSFRGDVRLKVLKEKLAEIHPADLADILEELDYQQRAIVFNQLDTSHASDTLEEIDPSVQRAILSSLSRGRIAQLVDEMTPGQAANVLAVLPSSELRAILKLLDAQNARKVRAILEKHEEKIINYATTSFVKYSPDMTVRQALERYRRIATVSDVIMYLYIVNRRNKLLGVIDMRELLKASNDALLKDVMVDVVASFSPESTLREASAMFGRYGFRAIPIVDAKNKILGVVPYRDMMSLKHRFLE
jgi:CBS domain-containing protein/sporulation protein YlmC with PRC-barrel domain